MLAYAPGDTFVHQLDPRTKLAFQAGFAVAAFTWTDTVALPLLTGVLAIALLTARITPVAAVAEYELPLVLLGTSVIVESVLIGPPWIDLGATRTAAIASYRVVLMLAVSTVYVKTTPVAETQAAMQYLLPGRIGRVLGAGTAFVLRFVPALQVDLRNIRDAMHTRLGDRLPLATRMRIVATGGLRRAFSRADTFSLALRARCFSWNPTLPLLRFSRRDVPVLIVGVLLVLAPII